MPKRVFWPVAMVILGLIFLASNLGMLPRAFWNLWPIILIVVGLGGFLTSDRDDWFVANRPARKTRKTTKKRAAKKTSRKAAYRKTTKKK